MQQGWHQVVDVWGATFTNLVTNEVGLLVTMAGVPGPNFDLVVMYFIIVWVVWELWTYKNHQSVSLRTTGTLHIVKDTMNVSLMNSLETGVILFSKDLEIQKAQAQYCMLTVCPAEGDLPALRVCPLTPARRSWPPIEPSSPLCWAQMPASPAGSPAARHGWCNRCRTLQSIYHMVNQWGALIYKLTASLCFSKKKYFTLILISVGRFMHNY